ncbi:hypothetical protein FB451DRAFT_1551276 [Mycena latifolia]|nr:hypothetical protein FB451DRAFT_1551276 [Mycena latifolia]
MPGHRALESAHAGIPLHWMHGAAAVLLHTLQAFTLSLTVAVAADSACIPRALSSSSRAHALPNLKVRPLRHITTYPSQSIPQAAPHAYTLEPQDTPRRANSAIQRPQDDTLVHGKYDSSLLSASLIPADPARPSRPQRPSKFQIPNSEIRPSLLGE